MKPKDEMKVGTDEVDTSRRERRKPDPELQAMARIDRILSALTPEQKHRVTVWACQREFGNIKVMPIPAEKNP
jgi:hypothetical protein